MLHRLWTHTFSRCFPYGCFQIIHFNSAFHCKLSILRYHYFWKHPYGHTQNWMVLSGIANAHNICGTWVSGRKQWNSLYSHQVAVSPTNCSTSSCNVFWPVWGGYSLTIRYTSDFWGGKSATNNVYSLSQWTLTKKVWTLFSLLNM